eukprot:3736083-Rhodomonas_salina.2
MDWAVILLMRNRRLCFRRSRKPAHASNKWKMHKSCKRTAHRLRTFELSSRRIQTPRLAHSEKSRESRACMDLRPPHYNPPDKYNL